MSWDHWHDRLTAREKALNLEGGFRFVYGPQSSLKAPKLAFMTLNPGRANAQSTTREVFDGRGNSYEVERTTTLSPITDQALRAYKFFGVAPSETMTGVICPFRTPSWEDLSAEARIQSLQLGQEFWSDLFARPSLKMILCCGNVTTSAVTDWLKARPVATFDTGWGKIKMRKFKTPAGVAIIGLPHLSRFRLFGRPASEAAIRLLAKA